MNINTCRCILPLQKFHFLMSLQLVFKLFLKICRLFPLNKLAVLGRGIRFSNRIIGWLFFWFILNHFIFFYYIIHWSCQLRWWLMILREVHACPNHVAVQRTLTKNYSVIAYSHCYYLFVSRKMKLFGRSFFQFHLNEQQFRNCSLANCV